MKIETQKENEIYIHIVVYIYQLNINQQKCTQ